VPTPNGDDRSRQRREGGQEPLVELTRVQPFEADVIAARLRASGIEAIVGADSVYESLSFAEGVPVLVAADEVARALALLDQ